MLDMLRQLPPPPSMARRSLPALPAAPSAVLAGEAVSPRKRKGVPMMPAQAFDPSLQSRLTAVAREPVECLMDYAARVEGLDERLRVTRGEGLPTIVITEASRPTVEEVQGMISSESPERGAAAIELGVWLFLDPQSP